jgi:hypothetical protein
VRVVNAGLGDATIVDEAELIERGLRVSPNLVVLVFSENDVADLNRPSTWERLAENRRAKSRFPLSIVYQLLRRTALWNFALQVRATSRVRGHPVDWTAAGQEDSTTGRLRETYRRALLALRDTLAARGTPFLLVVYPSHHAVIREAMRGQLVWVTRMATEAEVPLVSLLAPLAASRLPADTLYLLPYDGHPSPRGYELGAAYLADEMALRGPLTAACGGKATRSSAPSWMHQAAASRRARDEWAR